MESLVAAALSPLLNVGSLRARAAWGFCGGVAVRGAGVVCDVWYRRVLELALTSVQADCSVFSKICELVIKLSVG